MTHAEQNLNYLQQLRGTAAEAIAAFLIQVENPELRLSGVEYEEIKSRALAKIQIDKEVRALLTLAMNRIEAAMEAVINNRINSLLQPGVCTMTTDGRTVEVEMSEGLLSAKLKVTDVLTGAGLEVSDGAFVVFIDSRCASSKALRIWQNLIKDDTRLMVIPLEPPRGQTVQQVVAAKRQEDAGFTKQ